MARIFISYRRSDDPSFAGRIADSLGVHFGRDRIFIDVSSIPAGENFTHQLQPTIQRSDCLVVIIGPGWLTRSHLDGGYPNRLFEPADMVCREIQLALLHRRLIIPVLIGDTRMPQASDLPAVIEEFSRLQAIRVSNEDFHHQSRVLAGHIISRTRLLSRHLRSFAAAVSSVFLTVLAFFFISGLITTFSRPYLPGGLPGRVTSATVGLGLAAIIAAVVAPLLCRSSLLTLYSAGTFRRWCIIMSAICIAGGALRVSHDLSTDHPLYRDSLIGILAALGWVALTVPRIDFRNAYDRNQA